MNVQLTGIHLEITDMIREYVEKKVRKVVKHTDSIISIAVMLSVDKLQQKAEINVELAGKQIHMEASEPDLYAAIDAVTDKLSRALVKHKEMLKDYRKGSPVELMEPSE